MTQITLPNDNATTVNGQPNDFQDVLDNDVAIRDVVNGNLDNGNIAATANIAGSKLADLSISSSKLENGAVTNSKLADNSVSTAKVQDSAITTAKLADDSVTPAKLALDTVEYTQDHTVTSSFLQTVISEQPAPGTYLAFAGALIMDSSDVSANGSIHLMKNSSAVASSFVHGGSNRSAAIRPTKVEIGQGDTIGVRFNRVGSATGWTLSAYLTLLRIG